jgi:hypothetical protein
MTLLQQFVTGWSERARDDDVVQEMTPSLFDLSLEELRVRLEELDRWSRAQEFGDDDLEGLRAVVFARGGGPDDPWNDYHLVRNEYDRRAAEEFDLGQ